MFFTEKATAKFSSEDITRRSPVESSLSLHPFHPIRRKWFFLPNSPEFEMQRRVGLAELNVIPEDTSRNFTNIPFLLLFILGYIMLIMSMVFAYANSSWDRRYTVHHREPCQIACMLLYEPDEEFHCRFNAKFKLSSEYNFSDIDKFSDACYEDCLDRISFQGFLESCVESKDWYAVVSIMRENQIGSRIPEMKALYQNRGYILTSFLSVFVLANLIMCIYHICLSSQLNPGCFVWVVVFVCIVLVAWFSVYLLLLLFFDLFVGGGPYTEDSVLPWNYICVSIFFIASFFCLTVVSILAICIGWMRLIRTPIIFKYLLRPLYELSGLTMFTSIMIFCLTSLLMYTFIMGLTMEMSGTFVLEDNVYFYKKSTSMKVAIALHYIMCTWTIFFIFTLQDLVLSGSISVWYYTKEIPKEIVGLVFRKMIYYHTGTIAMGSFVRIFVFLISNLVDFITFVLKDISLLKKSPRLLLLFEVVTGWEARIITAVTGQPYFKSNMILYGIIKEDKYEIDTWYRTILPFFLLSKILFFSAATILADLVLEEFGNFRGIGGKKLRILLPALTCCFVFIIMIQHALFRPYMVSVKTILLCNVGNFLDIEDRKPELTVFIARGYRGMNKSVSFDDQRQ